MTEERSLGRPCSCEHGKEGFALKEGGKVVHKFLEKTEVLLGEERERERGAVKIFTARKQDK